jgi:hypothetical protein
MNSPAVFADPSAQRACWHLVAFAYRKAMRDLGLVAGAPVETSAE